MYRLKLKAFANADKSELSMIEVAHEILKEKGDTMAFVDLANEIQNYLGKRDEEIRERLKKLQDEQLLPELVDDIINSVRISERRF